MRAFLRQRGEIFHAVIVRARQASASAACLLEVSFRRAMGIKVVLDHRNTDLAGSFKRLLYLLNLFIAPRPSVGCIGESAEEQVAQGQTAGFELIDGRLKLARLPG